MPYCPRNLPSFVDTVKPIDWDSKITKKHIKEAKAVGLTLIEKGRNRNHRLYKFNSCNHQQEIMLHAVRIKNFRCNTCDQEKYEAEAKVVGLTLVGASGKKGYRTYKCNKCGNNQEITISLVRKNSFRCISCVTTNLEKEAKVVGLSISYQRTLVRIRPALLPSDLLIVQFHLRYLR